MKHQIYITDLSRQSTIICATRANIAVEVASHNLYIQVSVYSVCDSYRVFVSRINQISDNMWYGMKLVHGRPRHSLSYGSVECSNQDVHDATVAWCLIITQTMN